MSWESKNVSKRSVLILLHYHFVTSFRSKIQTISLLGFNVKFTNLLDNVKRLKTGRITLTVYGNISPFLVRHQEPHLARQCARQYITKSSNPHHKCPTALKKSQFVFFIHSSSLDERSMMTRYNRPDRDLRTGSRSTRLSPVVAGPAFGFRHSSHFYSPFSIVPPMSSV